MGTTSNRSAMIAGVAVDRLVVIQEGAGMVRTDRFRREAPAK
jgi:hypothetical protein